MAAISNANESVNLISDQREESKVKCEVSSNSSSMHTEETIELDE